MKGLVLKPDRKNKGYCEEPETQYLSKAPYIHCISPARCVMTVLQWSWFICNLSSPLPEIWNAFSTGSVAIGEAGTAKILYQLLPPEESIKPYDARLCFFKHLFSSLEERNLFYAPQYQPCSALSNHPSCFFLHLSIPRTTGRHEHAHQLLIFSVWHLQEPSCHTGKHKQSHNCLGQATATCTGQGFPVTHLRALLQPLEQPTTK